MPILVGSGMRQNVFAATVNPASIAANTTGETNVAITGAVPGQVFIVQPPSSLDVGIICASTAVCTTAGTVILRLGNVTVGAIDVASSTFNFITL